MTPAELKAKRHALGLSASGLAAALKMKGKGAGRTVRRWEAGTQDIPGYVELFFAMQDEIDKLKMRADNRADII